MIVTPSNKISQIDQEILKLCNDKIDSFLAYNDDISVIKREAFKRYSKKGLPNRFEESWKYTNIHKKLPNIPVSDKNYPIPLNVDNFINSFDIMSKIKSDNDILIVFMDGQFIPELSTLEYSKNGMEINFLSNGDVPRWASELMINKHNGNEDPLFDLNTILMQEGVLINVSANVKIDSNVYIIHIGNNDGFFNYRHVINVGKDSHINVTELKVSNRVNDALYTSSVLWNIEDNAIVNNVKYQAHNQSTVGFNQQYADVGSGSIFNSFTISSGSKLLRESRNISCNGENSEVSISGVNLLDGESHIDTTLVVSHKAPNSLSKEKYKSILSDRSRSVFQGNIVVDQIAQKTVAKQSIDALILSNDAEHDSKPELEIYADDVQCGHGATTGQLSADSLFYLRARGIGEDEARRLLVHAFISDVMEEIQDTNLRNVLRDVMNNMLNRVSKGRLNV